MYNNTSNYFSNSQFAHPPSSASFLNSIHLSPEELAAIDHGIVSGAGRAASFGTPFVNRPSNAFPAHHLNTPTPATYYDGRTPAPLAAQTTFNFNETSALNMASQPSQFYNTPPQSTAPGKNDENLVKTYETRIEGILKQERDRYNQMETFYRRELDSVKGALEPEKTKLEQVIQDLHRQINHLQQKLLSFSSSDRFAALQLHYDRKITTLTKQFEQEKLSAIEILKTRAKAEINLLIPKIRARCQESSERTHQEAMSRLKAKATAYIHQMKQDFELEKRGLTDQLRRKHQEDLKRLQSSLQSKYEMKLMQEKNAIERRFLDKFERPQQSQYPRQTPLHESFNKDFDGLKFNPIHTTSNNGNYNGAQESFFNFGESSFLL